MYIVYTWCMSTGKKKTNRIKRLHKKKKKTVPLVTWMCRRKTNKHFKKISRKSGARVTSVLIATSNNACSTVRITLVVGGNNEMMKTGKSISCWLIWRKSMHRCFIFYFFLVLHVSTIVNSYELSLLNARYNCRFVLFFCILEFVFSRFFSLALFRFRFEAVCVHFSRFQPRDVYRISIWNTCRKTTWNVFNK